MPRGLKQARSPSYRDNGNRIEEYRKPGIRPGAPRNMRCHCLGCGTEWNEFRNREGLRNTMCPYCYTDGAERFVDPETGRESWKILTTGELTNRNRAIAQGAAAKVAGWSPKEPEDA